MESRNHETEMACSGRETATIVLDNVTIGFPLVDGSTFIAVKDVSLEVAPGEFIAIVGPTGCGKSTLLSVVGPGEASKGSGD